MSWEDHCQKIIRMSWTTIRHTRVVNTGAAAPSDFRKIDYTPIDFEDC